MCSEVADMFDGNCSVLYLGTLVVQRKSARVLDGRAYLAAPCSTTALCALLMHQQNVQMHMDDAREAICSGSGVLPRVGDKYLNQSTVSMYRVHSSGAAEIHPAPVQA